MGGFVSTSNLNTISKVSDPTAILASQSAVSLDTVKLSTKTSVALTGITTGTGVGSVFNANDVVQSNLPITNGALSKVTTANVGGSLSTISNNALSSVTSANVGGSLSTISNGVVSATSAARNTVNGALGSVTNAVNAGSAFLQSAIKSVTGTFSKSATALASGIDGALKSIFNDTNVASASTVATSISDPVKTNLTALKPPVAAAFKISSIEAGSQVVTMAGVSSQFGSKADTMIGTDLSTLLNRLNLDSAKGLASGITNTASKSALSGLLSDVKNVSRGVSQLAGAVQTAKSTILNTKATVLKSINNDLQVFMGRTGTVGNLINTNPADYFVANTNSSLFDPATGLNVDTRSSGVDANTANALLNLVKVVGCDIPAQFYESVNELDSLFNAILSWASSLNLDDLVDNLLSCSRSTTASGQDSIVSAFVSSAGSDVTMSDKLLQSVSNPALLDSDSIYKTLVTNPNLNAADVGTMGSITNTLGRTLTDSYTVSGISGDITKVYDLSSVSNSNTPFLNSAFGDTTLSTFCLGTDMSLSSDGTFGF